MKKIKKYKKSKIIFENVKNLDKFLPTEDVIVITDEVVNELCKFKYPTIVIGTGEKIKNLKTIEYIIEELLKLEADKSTFLLGVGGGIVTDITGFVASIYKRGLRFGFIPTTLLAQVDASIGGKNGVNFNKYKNIIGVINQPKLIFYDMNLLKTLSRKETICGFGEIIKHAIIADKKMFKYLEKIYNKTITKKSLKKLLLNSLKIKSDIVNKDETEKGIRKILNFGHTFGHAIEKTSDEYLHGEAIGIGMTIASKISLNKGYINEKTYDRIIDILKNYGLPTEVPNENLIKVIKNDKKRNNLKIDLILIKGIGKPVIESIKIDKIDVLYR